MRVDDRYQLVRWIGRGGLADVFEAADRWTGHAVVVKRLRPHWRGDRRAEAHFVVEACALRRLARAPVAHLRAEGVTPERLRYLVLDRFDGAPLDAAIAAWTSLPVALSAFARVLEIVARIHRLGVLHGDLKPGNVMVANDPRGVALIDFGLAVIAGMPAARPRGFGTPEYLAPELIAGGARAVATEVYALGAMLYEVLAGSPPFAGATAEEIVRGHLDDPVVPPSVRTGAPIAPALEDVALRALAKSPDARFASVNEMWSALRRTRDAWSSAAPPAPRPGWDHLATIPCRTGHAAGAAA